MVNPRRALRVREQFAGVIVESRVVDLLHAAPNFEESSVGVFGGPFSGLLTRIRNGLDRYELKLSKQVGPLVKEWCDVLLFGNYFSKVAAPLPMQVNAAPFPLLQSGKTPQPQPLTVKLLAFKTCTGMLMWLETRMLASIAALRPNVWKVRLRSCLFAYPIDTRMSHYCRSSVTEPRNE